MALKVSVRIQGADAIVRAFDRMPFHAITELKDGSERLAGHIVTAQRAAGVARGRQARWEATHSLRVIKAKRLPTIEAGVRGGRKARNLIFGSEFGMTRHTGWYNRRRYNHPSAKPQYFRHIRGSYWFMSTVDSMQPQVERAWLQMVDNIVEKWGGYR